jgi:serine/threonine protein kinase
MLCGEIVAISGDPSDVSMIVVVCPGCHRRLQLADSPGGHEGQCAHCGRHVRLGGPRVDPTTDTNDTAIPVRETGANAPPPPKATAPGYEFLRPPQLPDELGRLGEYRVLQLLGQGAMGMVFRAEDTGLGRTVALKVMIPSVASMIENRQRFLREAQATAKVNHVNVIPIYTVGEDRGVPYLAMPLLKGELLEARLNRERRLPIRDAVRLSREIAEGLAAAHERNLVHRDIKPANLFLETVQRRSATDRIKILDFGLARMGDTGLTTPGAVLGTPAYMSPEQAKGLTADYRCDLFSLGSVMYRMLTGQRPFAGDEVFAVLMALTTVRATPPHELNPEVPLGLSELIMHLHAKEPDDRPQSAAEVVDRLNRLGLISGIASTDKMPVHRAGSSGSLPIYGSSTATVRTSPNDLQAKGEKTESKPVSRMSVVLAIGIVILLVICLIVVLAMGAFGTRPDGSSRTNVNAADTEVAVHSEKEKKEVKPADLAPELTPAKPKGEEKQPPKEIRPDTPPEVIPPPPNETPKEKKPEPLPDPPKPKPPEIKGNETKTQPTVSDVKEPRPENAPIKETKPSPISTDRRAALWVLDCGGEVVLKRQGRATADTVRSSSQLPKPRFDVVMIGLEKSQKVSNSGLSALSGLRELTELNLSGTPITDAAIARLRSLPHLQILTLCDTNISDRAVPDLASLDSLRNLNLQNTKITTNGVRQLKSALKNCDITEP